MGSAKSKSLTPSLVDGLTAFEWNQKGVSLNNDDNQLLGSLDCYCNAIAASPGEWLGYQNAGHCSIRLSWWEGSIWFHEAVRQLDHAYDSRAEADKCECLTHAKASLKAAKKRSYIRLWCFEDVTPPGFDLAQLNGEENIDPCWTARRTPQGSFILRVNGQPFEFESITKRQHALSGLVAICREKEARRALEAMSTSAISVHPVLRSDVLQHIMSFFTDDWKELASLGLVCKSWLRVSCHNSLWRSVWLRHKFPDDARLKPAEFSALRNVASFGSDGFLKRLLLRHPPLVCTSIPQAPLDESNSHSLEDE